jgi:tryptophan-rich sensory protein
MMNERLRNVGWFLISLLACYLAAFVGSFFTIDEINTWYTTIQKPSINPPNWLFGPVWSALYTMMGICFYLINSSYHPLKKTAQILFISQLILNA